MHPKNTPDRMESINQALHITASRGVNSGAQAAGPALAAICRDALEDDAGKTDARSVIINTMKNMRAAMEELRDELDGIDSVGKYK